MGHSSEGHQGPLPVDLPDRLLAPRSRTCCTPPARALPLHRRGRELGRRCRPNWRGATPRRWTPRAVRSPRTRRGSRPTRLIFAFDESPVTPGLLWAGTDDGLVCISRNNAVTLAERDAARHRRLHAHLDHRAVALRRRNRLRGGQSLRVRRQVSRSSTRRPTTARRGRRSSTGSPPITSPGPSARIRCVAGCCSPGRSAASYVSFDDGQQLAVAAAEPAARPGA